MNNDVKKVLVIKGMTCTGCELRIENALTKIPGMIHVNISYAGESAHITFDSSITDIAMVTEVIETLGYSVKSVVDAVAHPDKPAPKKYKGIIIALGIFVVIALIIVGLNAVFDFSADSLEPNAGYGVLFIVGIITSLHCLFMCGGISLATCTSYSSNPDRSFSKIKPSLLYNTGRVVTCTVVGGIVGSIGSIVKMATGTRGIVLAIAGAFMVLMGLTMLNLFPALRKITPRLPKFLGKKVYDKIGRSGPFVVGLLNGFMPCGAVQSMQIYALGTGSAITGALSMFFFSVGTVPLMLGFGALTSALSESFASKMMKVGAVVIIVMGLVMLLRGVFQ